MTVAMKQESSKLILLGLILAVLMSLFSPLGLTASADNSGSANNSIPTVELGENGITMGGSGFSDGDGKGAWSQIISKYRTFIVGISGIAAVTMVVIFIFQFLKLGASAGNPQGRSQALTGLLWSGLAAAGLGAVSLIVGLFYRSIQ